MPDLRSIFSLGENTPARIIDLLKGMGVVLRLNGEKIIASSKGLPPERAMQIIRENRDALYDHLSKSEPDKADSMAQNNDHEHHGYICSVHQAKLVKYRIANGSIWAGEVCQLCGQVTKRVSVKSIDLSSVPLMDRQSVLDRWNEKREQYWKDYHAKKREEFENERNARKLRYVQHLSSEKWKRLRVRIFNRCKGICEGCGINKATQVHHLTYDRMGDEMLFDLAAMCAPCHKKVHGLF